MNLRAKCGPLGDKIPLGEHERSKVPFSVENGGFYCAHVGAQLEWWGMLLCHAKVSGDLTPYFLLSNLKVTLKTWAMFPKPSFPIFISTVDISDILPSFQGFLVKRENLLAAGSVKLWSLLATVWASWIQALAKHVVLRWELPAVDGGGTWTNDIPGQMLWGQMSETMSLNESDCMGATYSHVSVLENLSVYSWRRFTNCVSYVNTELQMNVWSNQTKIASKELSQYSFSLSRRKSWPCIALYMTYEFVWYGFIWFWVMVQWWLHCSDKCRNRRAAHLIWPHGRHRAWQCTRSARQGWRTLLWSLALVRLCETLW